MVNSEYLKTHIVNVLRFAITKSPDCAYYCLYIRITLILLLCVLLNQCCFKMHIECIETNAKNSQRINLSINVYVGVIRTVIIQIL